MIRFLRYDSKKNILTLEITWAIFGNSNETSNKQNLFFEELKTHAIIPQQSTPPIYHLENCTVTDFLIKLKVFFLRQNMTEAQWQQFTDSVPLRKELKFLASSPMHVAAAFSRTADIAWLIKQKIKVDTEMERGPMRGCSPLFLAAALGQVEAVQTLIRYGADFQAPASCGANMGCTPLFIAVAKNHKETAHCLIRQGADLQTPLQEGLNRGCTPLFIAALLGHFEILELLVEHQADFQIPLAFGLNEGLTPLCAAIAQGHIKIIWFLIAQGADFSSPLSKGPNAGLTPLCIAIMEGQIDIVQLLLEKEVDYQAAITTGENKGYTPLCLAVLKGHLKIAQLLVEKGADTQTPLLTGPYQGVLPLHLAALAGKEDITGYLLALNTKNIAASFHSPLKPPFFHRLFKLACDPANRSQQRILKLLIEAYPAAREISYKGKTISNLGSNAHELQPYMETELEKIMKVLVIDKLPEITSLLSDTAHLNYQLIEVTKKKGEIKERPVADLKELIIDKLTALCLFYEEDKLYISRYYYEIKTALNRAAAVKKIPAKWLQAFPLSQTDAKRLAVTLSNLCQLTTCFYMEQKKLTHQELFPITEYRVEAAAPRPMTQNTQKFLQRVNEMSAEKIQRGLQVKTRKD